MSIGCVLVTGGAGFVGSALVRRLLREPELRVVTLDNLTYAGHLESLDECLDAPRHTFVRADICDRESLRDVFRTHAPDAVMHLAAESHVDRSIDAPAAFVETNILGTYALLEEALAYWRGLDSERRDAFRMLHVSTDEVFGSLGVNGRFHVQSPYRPSSPYSASKAAADHLARAWQHTFELPVLVTHCSNNYGPRQFPEKLIPLAILNALDDRPLPVYGSGQNVRDWLFVDDHAEGLLLALRHGRPGQSYAFGAECERTNLALVRAVCALLDELQPRADGAPHASRIEFVADRPGHDLRYGVDPHAATHALGWRPRESFEAGLRKTVAWYLANRSWCRAVSRNADPLVRRGRTAWPAGDAEP